MILLESEECTEASVNATEAHERNGKQACCHESDRHSLHSLWNSHDGKLFADAGKDCKSQTETHCC